MQKLSVSLLSSKVGAAFWLDLGEIAKIKITHRIFFSDTDTASDKLKEQTNFTVSFSVRCCSSTTLQNTSLLFVIDSLMNSVPPKDISSLGVLMVVVKKAV